MDSLLIVLEIAGAYALLYKRLNVWEAMAYPLYFYGAVPGLGVDWTYAFAVPQMAATSPAYVDAVYPGLVSQGMSVSFGIAFLGTF